MNRARVAGLLLAAERELRQAQTGMDGSDEARRRYTRALEAYAAAERAAYETTRRLRRSSSLE